jgi:heat shock protein HslJ
MRIAIVALMLGLGGCVSVHAPPGGGAAVVGGQAASAVPTRGIDWHAREIGGVAVPGGSPVTLRFDHRRVSGQVCNHYSGPYELLPGQRIRFGPIFATRMSCGAAGDAQERRFFGVVSGTATYQMEGNQLILTGADGRTIRFVRAGSPG